MSTRSTNSKGFINSTYSPSTSTAATGSSSASPSSSSASVAAPTMGTGFSGGASTSVSFNKEDLSPGVARGAEDQMLAQRMATFGNNLAQQSAGITSQRSLNAGLTQSKYDADQQAARARQQRQWQEADTNASRRDAYQMQALNTSSEAQARAQQIAGQLALSESQGATQEKIAGIQAQGNMFGSLMGALGNFGSSFSGGGGRYW